MRLFRLCVPLALITAAVLLPSIASAHARLGSSTPAVGEVLQASPTAVEITFTQEIQKVSGLYSIKVTNAAGADVTALPAVVNETDRTKMSVQLQPALPPGRYVVNWHNVSDADGDPLDGAFSFYIQNEPTASDLEDDQRLALIGQEETPQATAETSPAPTTAPVTSAPAASPTATAATSSGGGGSNTTVYVVVGVLAVAAVGAAGAWWFFARRSA